jgi:hypothetical protein
MRIKTPNSIIFIGILTMFPAMLNAQVLISLLFGKALNTDKIEFGLAGGMNHSYINTISGSEPMNSFDIGFYFHVLMKNSTYLSTGVHVKSNLGATGMPVYSRNDPDFDAVYSGGTLTKKIPGFYVPILLHQRFNNRWYIEAGPQLGLIYKELDIFDVKKLDGDLTYTLSVKDQYKHIDAGLLAGIGYKFKKEIKSMAVGINYYYGLVDVSTNPDYQIKNSTINVYMKIPIGVGSKEEITK